MFDLGLDDEGPGDPLVLAKLGLQSGEKFTLLGVGLGVGGIFILKSSMVSSRVLEGISNTRFFRLRCEGILSSMISVKPPTCEKITERKKATQKKKGGQV